MAVPSKCQVFAAPDPRVLATSREVDSPDTRTRSPRGSLRPEFRRDTRTIHHCYKPTDRKRKLPLQAGRNRGA